MFLGSQQGRDPHRRVYQAYLTLIPVSAREEAEKHPPMPEDVAHIDAREQAGE